MSLVFDVVMSGLSLDLLKCEEDGRRSISTSAHTHSIAILC